MRGQLNALLPRQAVRRHAARRQGDPRRCDPRGVALRYAAWDWPVGPDPVTPATTDPEKVFAAWTRLPDAPILAACGEAFDAVVADAALVRAALARLDRLGVAIGPVVAWPGLARELPWDHGSAGGGSGGGTIAVLVRAGTAASIGALLERRAASSTAPVVIGAGARFELPASLDAHPRPGGGGCERSWLRPPAGPRPTLPAAHVILGALALVPYRTLNDPLGR
jgi:hypothetical protein